jgi:hypothetical protein
MPEALDVNERMGVAVDRPACGALLPSREHGAPNFSWCSLSAQLRSGYQGRFSADDPEETPGLEAEVAQAHEHGRATSREAD